MSGQAIIDLVRPLILWIIFAGTSIGLFVGSMPERVEGLVVTKSSQRVALSGGMVPLFSVDIP